MIVLLLAFLLLVLRGGIGSSNYVDTYYTSSIVQVDQIVALSYSPNIFLFLTFCPKTYTKTPTLEILFFYL